MRNQHENAKINKYIWITLIVVVALLLLIPSILYIINSSSGKGKEANNELAVQLVATGGEKVRGGVGQIATATETISDNIVLDEERKNLEDLISRGETLLQSSAIKQDKFNELQEKIKQYKSKVKDLNLESTKKAVKELEPLIAEGEKAVKENEERQKLFVKTKELISKGNTLVTNQYITGENKGTIQTNLDDAKKMVEENKKSPSDIEEFNKKFENILTQGQDIVDAKEKEKKENEQRTQLFGQTTQLIDEGQALEKNSKITTSEKEVLQDSLKKADEMVRANSAKPEDVETFNKSFAKQMDAIKKNIEKRS